MENIEFVKLKKMVKNMNRFQQKKIAQKIAEIQHDKAIAAAYFNLKF